MQMKNWLLIEDFRLVFGEFQKEKKERNMTSILNQKFLMVYKIDSFAKFRLILAR